MSTTDRKGHSIRMSAEELATIKAAAGDMPWSTWLRELGLAMAAIEARGASVVVVVEPRAEPDPWLGYHPDPALVARAEAEAARAEPDPWLGYHPADRALAARAKAEAEGPRPKPPKPPEPERRARRNAALFGFVED